ncbi:MAG: PQQ-dependent sugar dehydrogenase [Acidobacteriota bacterium]|nr:PQQ-dependent sugar dehydrogenase [Acidobacteriota bacterium]
MGRAPRLARLVAVFAPFSWSFLGPTGATAALPVPIELLEIASRLSRPIALTHAGDGSGRLFIALQDGRIVIHDGARVQSTPFLDISSAVACCGEQGLLGLAFHPQFEDNGLFFVNYTDTGGDTRISRFSVGTDPDAADPESETEVLFFRQPFGNHNGGALEFGPDGYLYIASGDGGSGGDPQDNAQSLDTRLGKILRIDVGGSPFGIPPDNPFVGTPGALDEIWAYGLRNPWRISFDRLTGDLFIGDVGQGEREEIDLQLAASQGGENYGWRRMEGSACFNPSTSCNTGELVLPILEYGHDEGCSVTGGYRYRGAASPALGGYYFFGDFCSGTIWGARPGTDGTWSRVEMLDSGLSLSSFGEDESGELYALDHAGSVFRIRSELIFADGFESGDTSRWKRKGGRLEVLEPGLDGTRFALSVNPEQTSRNTFVRSREPKRASTLVVSFFLNPNRVELGGREIDVVALAGGGRQHVKVAIEQTAERYRAKLYARGNAGDFEIVGSTRVPGNRGVRLTVEWRRASSEEARDGSVLLRKKNRPRAMRDDLQNGRLVVRDLQVGLPTGSTLGGTSGTLLLDEFLVTP